MTNESRNDQNAIRYDVALDSQAMRDGLEQIRSLHRFGKQFDEDKDMLPGSPEQLALFLAKSKTTWAYATHDTDKEDRFPVVITAVSHLTLALRLIKDFAGYLETARGNSVKGMPGAQNFRRVVDDVLTHAKQVVEALSQNNKFDDKWHFNDTHEEIYRKRNLSYALHICESVVQALDLYNNVRSRTGPFSLANTPKLANLREWLGLRAWATEQMIATLGILSARDAELACRIGDALDPHRIMQFADRQRP